MKRPIVPFTALLATVLIAGRGSSSGRRGLNPMLEHPRILPLILFGLIFSLVLGMIPAGALAANPGIDGRMAYVGYVPVPNEPDAVYEAIFTSNPDGSYPRVVPNTGTPSGDEWPSEPVWSPDSSRLAFITETADVPGMVNVINLDGTGRTQLAKGIHPAWTADGQWISYTAAGPNNDWDTTYKVPASGGDPDIVIDGANVEWSPDGTRIAFERGWPPDVFVRDLGTGDEVNITPDSPETWDFLDDWSPDSQTLALDSSGAWPDEGVTSLASADGTSIEPFLAPAYTVSWSPSGTRLIYNASTEDGNRLRIINLDGSVVSEIGIWANQPSWGSAPLARDTIAPSTSALAAVPRSGATLSGSSVPLLLTWSGKDDVGGSGIARYELARSVNGGTWATVSTSLTTRTASVAAASAGTIRYRVRAIDKAGNAGAWAYGPTLSPRLVQQSTSTVKYGGTWYSALSSSYSGGSARYAQTAGRSASYTFTGRSIGFVTTKASSRGKVKVYINGVYQATVDLYRSSFQNRVVAWQKTWSTPATRTVKLVVAGTSGRPRVDLDAFVVLK